MDTSICFINAHFTAHRGTRLVIHTYMHTYIHAYIYSYRYNLLVYYSGDNHLSVCTHVCNVCMYVCMYVSMCVMYVCAYVCIMYVCMYAIYDHCNNSLWNKIIDKFTYANNKTLYVCMCVCMYVCMLCYVL